MAERAGLLASFEYLDSIVDSIHELRKAGFKIQSADATRIPETSVPLTGADARAVLRLVEALESDDDVSKVYANFDISAAEMEAASVG